MHSKGTARPRSNTADSNAPVKANENATANMVTFDRAANVGRERGNESPIRVPPANRP